MQIFTIYVVTDLKDKSFHINTANKQLADNLVNNTQNRVLRQKEAQMYICENENDVKNSKAIIAAHELSLKYGMPAIKAAIRDLPDANEMNIPTAVHSG